ncbi:hypothetical protein HETIRDRAFT_325778, partial [Heterobasidion irregulare TC 32-1]
YASPGQYGESARNNTPPSLGRVEARRYGYLQGAGVVATPIYGADPYAPYQIMAHYTYYGLPLLFRRLSFATDGPHGITAAIRCHSGSCGQCDSFVK